MTSLHPVDKNPDDRPEEYQLLPFHEPPQNTSEGSEFLDDAIRMEDQAQVYTEQSIAAGSPENLL